MRHELIDGLPAFSFMRLQAIKEEKMEVTLGQLAERWASVSWGMDPYKGGDVPLLKIAEEDFEALEVSLGTRQRFVVIIKLNVGTLTTDDARYLLCFHYLPVITELQQEVANRLYHSEHASQQIGSYLRTTCNAL